MIGSIKVILGHFACVFPVPREMLQRLCRGPSHASYTCSKSTVETPEKLMKSVQS